MEDDGGAWAHQQELEHQQMLEEDELEASIEKMEHHAIKLRQFVMGEHQ